MNGAISELRRNLPQFALLVIVNGFVGAMVGMERSILPALAEGEFHLVARSALLSFIVVFGITKAATNYVAGRLCDAIGRKPVLIAGWLLAAPVPLLLMWAPSWSWILVANAFLGVSQGLTWSTAVIMKIDLAGNERRGLAMGINEFAGYFAVALSALLAGFLAAEYGVRTAPFVPGVAYVIVGALLSLAVVKETRPGRRREDGPASISQREVVLRTTLTDRNLSSVTQAGFVNNLNDGVAWGLFPLVFAAAGLSLSEVGVLAALYPAVWGLSQLVAGPLSDRLGRKPLIVAGMWVQAVGIALTAWTASTTATATTSTSIAFALFSIAAVLLGVGTALVYPTLLAAIGDVAHASWRASSVGVYRLWRDLGYAAGAAVAGIAADRFGVSAAITIVGVITFLSGALAAVRMTETHLRP